MVSFQVSGADRAKIGKIVNRTLDILSAHKRLEKADRTDRRLNLIMDVTACHANGNPLDLARLLEADDFNVMHDVGGISRHICRDTGKLLNHFVPRFSARQQAQAAS